MNSSAMNRIPGRNRSPSPGDSSASDPSFTIATVSYSITGGKRYFSRRLMARLIETLRVATSASMGPASASPSTMSAICRSSSPNTRWT